MVEKSAYAARIWTATGIFLLMLIATVLFRAAPLTFAEGETLYIVRDSVELASDDGPRALLNSLIQQFRTTFERATDSNRDPLYHLLLDVWTLFTGDRVFSARWFSLLWALLALAIARRITRHLPVKSTRIGWFLLPIVLLVPATTASEWSWWLFWAILLYTFLLRFRKRPFTTFTMTNSADRRRIIPLLISVLFLLLYIVAGFIDSIVNRPTWDDIRDVLDTNRVPTEPLLTTYAEDHPFAALDHQSGTRFTTGLVIRTGWRDDRAPDAVVDAIISRPTIWVIRRMGADDYTALSATHTPRIMREAGDMALIRYDIKSEQ